MTAVLIDTNILVYAHDLGEHAKQMHAIHVLERLQLGGNGCLSVQCLAEFFSITTRGKTPKLTIPEAERQVEYLALAYSVFPLTLPIVLEAARGVREHQLAYDDAQIWATAKLYQIPAILSEDFSSGSTLEGIRFVNPFDPGFAIEQWV
jgi:predicted nucleic acid-binding protein